MLRALETYIGTQSASIVLRRPNAQGPGTIISFHENARAKQEFQDRWYEDSPFANLPEQKVLVLREVVPQSELEQLDHYRHFMKVHGVIDLMGFDIYEEASRIRVRVRVIRMEGEPLFNQQDKETLSSIVPLMDKAVSMFARMESHKINKDIYQEILGSLHIGCFFLNSELEVTAKNALASQILERGDGLALHNKSIRCVNANDDSKLQSTLSDILESTRLSSNKSSSSLQIKRREDEQNWSALVRPAFRSRELIDEKGPRLVLMLRDPDHRLIPTTAILGEAFGLSKAEAKLALELTEGLSLTAAAHSLGISRNTARTQLSSIFSKTGVHSQAQFIKRVTEKLSSLWFV